MIYRQKFDSLSALSRLFTIKSVSQRPKTQSRRIKQSCFQYLTCRSFSLVIYHRRTHNNQYGVWRNTTFSQRPLGERNSFSLFACKSVVCLCVSGVLKPRRWEIEECERTEQGTEPTPGSRRAKRAGAKPPL